MLCSHQTFAAAFLISAISLCTDARAQNASKKTAQKSPGKHYVLPANKDTVQWGWYDPTEKPRLVVNSGDTVSIETWRHGMDEIKPGVPMGEIIKLRIANDGGGPHSITGPIYVNDAEPGDTMEIRITKIVMKDTGFNFNLPGKQFPTVGLLASEFPEGHVEYFKLPASQTLPRNYRRRSRSCRAERESRPSHSRRQRAH
jgi:predicted RNA-binding protein with TRAM domain